MRQMPHHDRRGLSTTLMLFLGPDLNRNTAINGLIFETNLAPSFIQQNVASLIFDTMGIFWTMKYKNEKDVGLLKEWGLETKNLPIKVFVPFGKVEEYKKKNIPFRFLFQKKVSFFLERN